jgi:hypothetical protein
LVFLLGLLGSSLIAQVNITGTNQSGALDGQIYKSEKYGFQISYPGEWEVGGSDEWITFTSPEFVGMDHNWTIFIHPASDLEKVISDMGKQFDDRKETRSGVTVNGAEGMLVRVTTESHADWEYINILFTKGDRLVALGNGAIRDKRFEEFYRSFKYLD